MKDENIFPGEVIKIFLSSSPADMLDLQDTVRGKAKALHSSRSIQLREFTFPKH